MRGVSKRFRRSAALLSLVTILLAQGAVAADRDAGRGVRDRIERTKWFVVTIFNARFSIPPGDD
jgi:hypothetical protein